MEILLNLVKNDSNYELSEINNIIGQTNVIKKLNFYIKSNKSGCIFPTLLFSGSHGLGKTFLAEKVAEKLNRRFILINSKPISSIEYFVEDILLQKVIGDSQVTILIDECHNLSKDVSAILLTLLNPNKENINYLKYKNFSIVYDMSKINIIFATTDSYDMCKPLKNRCETLYFELYKEQEIINILKQYIGNINLDCDLSELAYACRCRARDAFLLAKNIERYSNINNTKTINKKDWEEMKVLFDIKPMGLNNIDLDLLKYIKDHEPISCMNIAMSFMVHEEYVKNEMECRLRELDFITNMTRGRTITEKGRNYLKENNFA